jgi:hypothetical protein
MHGSDAPSAGRVRIAIILAANDLRAFRGTSPWSGTPFCLPSADCAFAHIALEGTMTAPTIWRTAVRFALNATLAALVTTRPAFAEQTRVVSSGESASVNAFDGSCAWTFVSVSRNTNESGTEAYLQYSVWDGCVAEYLTYGSGRIANDDFKITNKAAKVHTDLSYDPNFSSFGAIGRVDVTWTINPDVSDRFDGTWESKRPEYRIRQKGTSESLAAGASGTVVGKALQSADGSVYTFKSVFVEHLH